MNHRGLQEWVLWIGLWGCCLSVALQIPSLLSGSDDDGIEFFEKRIRPVLVKQCYSCHGPEVRDPFGELRVDSRDSLLRGGARGPAVIPGRADSSLLFQAISYQRKELQMPPTGRLSDAELEDFQHWIEIGAPDPREDQRGSAGQKIDLEKGRRFWCFRPVQDHDLPEVKDEEWVRSPLDHFILARLESGAMAPAHEAEKGDWLRRVTFDLTGLPPAPGEVVDFREDNSPKAHQKVVDRLLNSQHYGERWARHWLDLVRFAETNGHEYDDDKLDAWRYRDYVIRAFNQDLPYDRFVREQIAGDLIPDKRLSQDGSFWESPVGTGIFWFGEILNSPTDSIKRRADEVDNQLDVLAKAFLGLTVSCARCHDHKFDPIPTADYYSLAGVLHGTRLLEGVVDSPSRTHQIRSGRQRIHDLNAEVTEVLQGPQREDRPPVSSYLLAAADMIAGNPAARGGSREELHPDALRQWTRVLDEACADPTHLFYPFALVLDQHGHPMRRSVAEEYDSVRAELNSWVAPPVDSFLVFDDFDDLQFNGWRPAGEAFGHEPIFEVQPNQPLSGYRGNGLASSFGGADQLTGSLTTAEFTVPRRWIHVRLAGTRTESEDENTPLRFSLVNGGYKRLTFAPRGEKLEWQSEHLRNEVSRTCWLEIVDRSQSGHIVVDQIVFSDSSEPPRSDRPNRFLAELLREAQPATLEEAARLYDRLFEELRNPGSPDGDWTWLSRAASPFPVLGQPPLDLDKEALARIGSLQSLRAEVSKRIPASIFALMSMDDPNAGNIRVHIRGDHHNLGEEPPRGFLRVIDGESRPQIFPGSGRLELAHWLTSPENSVTPRVMVNRVWKHHFGSGLVDSVDNFGATGKRPTHPQLLDYLTSRFVREGWSIKNLHRLIVLSSTYRQASRSNPTYAERDPNNELLHHFPVRRLEAEAIRDSLLAVSGALDRTMFGPAIPPHISKYQSGRGRPSSGPLDGLGRRSIYIQVRRNFLTPLFLAFDYPLPISTMGRRTTSTVPSQALIMMNNEFVNQQSRHWSERLASLDLAAEERIQRMYLEAFARLPVLHEKGNLLKFLERQARLHQEAGSPDETGPWQDAAQVLMSSPEFMYIR